MKKRQKRFNKNNDMTFRYKLIAELMERVPDVIYFKDKEGRLVMVNKAHANGLGLKPEEVMGKTDFDFFPRKRAELMARDDRYVMETGKPIVDKVERATRPDGEDNYVSTTKVPRYDEEGNIVGLIGITRDISSRKYSEIMKQEKARMERKFEALRELSDLKSEFISVVSHELRTPLAIIKEAVNLMYDEISGPLNEKQKEILAKTSNNIKRLNRIIEELLDISRIERGTLKLHFSLINFKDLLNDSSEFFRNSAAEKEIELKYTMPKKEVNIFVDADRINQVISNLISNAVKFTEKNGNIEVELRILENKIRVGVMDTGIGIGTEDMHRLFDKFVQVAKGGEVGRKGVGLGLAIAKELVEKHDGEIWAESKLGAGTRIYFTLPRFYTSKSLGKNVREEINATLRNRKKVYLVNLVIVNFRKFKKSTRVDPRNLFKDLGAMLKSRVKMFSGEGDKKGKIALSDYANGEWSMLFTEVKNPEIKRLSNSIKRELVDYVKKKKIKNLFINLGMMPYSKKTNLKNRQENEIDIRNIYVGLEIRRFDRIGYKKEIKLTLDDNKTETTMGVDISEGGLCFTTERKFVTNETVGVKFAFSKTDMFETKARVAWKKEIAERAYGNYANKYKVGLEFVDFGKKDKKRLSGLIKTVSSKR